MRLGIVSDAHGCVEGFEKALGLLERFRIDGIRFLGDAIGYFPGFSVVDRLVEEGIPSVVGNHERMALDGSFQDRDDAYRLRETLDGAQEHHWDFLRSLPESRSVESPGGRIDFMHGAPFDRVCGYLYPDADLEAVDPGGAAIVCMGHTHRPFVREAGGCLFVNVGSCAMPRDGGMLGCFGVLDVDEKRVELFQYDVSDAFRKAMARCGPMNKMVTDLLNRPREETPCCTFIC